jgi:hypothetical protein
VFAVLRLTFRLFTTFWPAEELRRKLRRKLLRSFCKEIYQMCGLRPHCE